MAQQDPLEKTDYSLHTDEELREAIATAEREEPRLIEEGADTALDTSRRQRGEMQAELDRRAGA